LEKGKRCRLFEKRKKIRIFLLGQDAFLDGGWKGGDVEERSFLIGRRGKEEGGSETKKKGKCLFIGIAWVVGEGWGGHLLEL